MATDISTWSRGCVAVLALVLAGPLPAQDPTPDPDLPRQLDELKEMVAQRDMSADFQAIGLMQKLGQGLDQRVDKDKERLAKGLGVVFRTGKLRTDARDVLYRETADVLARIGSEGAKEIAKAVTSSRFKDNIPLQAHMMLALGRSDDPTQVQFLLETTIRSPHDELRAASGEALGSFTDLDLRVRRDIVKALVREWGSLHQQATTPDPTDPSQPIPMQPQNARQTLRLVEGKWIATLRKLTGQSYQSFADWQRWLNKNPRWTPQ